MSTLVDTATVAAHLDLTEQTVLKHARSGIIPGKKYGGRWRFDLEQIDHAPEPTDPWAQSPQSRGRRRAS